MPTALLQFPEAGSTSTVSLRSTRYPARGLRLRPCLLFRHDRESYHLTALFFYLTIYPSADYHIVDHALHSRLHLHCDKETEILGVDDAEMGELAYDYVSIKSNLMLCSEYNKGASGGNRELRHTAATTSQVSKQEKDPKQLVSEA